MKIKSWAYALLALVVLWSVTYGVIQWIRSSRMDADKIAFYIQSGDLDGLSGAERDAYLEGLADRVNRLEFDERQKLQARRELEPAFKKMSEEERLRLIDQTLPGGFNQLMDALNKMTPDQRQRWVERGLQNLKDAQKRYAENPGETPPGMDKEVVQKFAQQGFQSYLENASSETKMDMAPLLEQIQMNLQGLRNP